MPRRSTPTHARLSRVARMQAGHDVPAPSLFQKRIQHFSPSPSRTVLYSALSPNFTQSGASDREACFFSILGPTRRTRLDLDAFSYQHAFSCTPIHAVPPLAFLLDAPTRRIQLSASSLAFSNPPLQVMYESSQLYTNTRTPTSSSFQRRSLSFPPVTPATHSRTVAPLCIFSKRALVFGSFSAPTQTRIINTHQTRHTQTNLASPLAHHSALVSHSSSIFCPPHYPHNPCMSSCAVHVSIHPAISVSRSFVHMSYPRVIVRCLAASLPVRNLGPASDFAQLAWYAKLTRTPQAGVPTIALNGLTLQIGKATPEC